MKDWLLIIKLPFTTLISILVNPSFIIFSIIALGLGTMGIWLSFFNVGMKDGVEFWAQIDNLSVFTFCVATLGGAATDFFFEEKYILDENQSKTPVHFMFFIWVSAFLTSFKALNSDDWIFAALLLTISFWLAINKNKPIFMHPNQEAMDNLNPSNPSLDKKNDEITGGGL